MKKLLTLALAMILVLAILAGCSAPAKEEPAEAPAEAMYQDGIYTATYSHLDNHGWRPEVVVTIADGKIESAMMDYYKPDGSKKSEDEAYSATMEGKSGITPKAAYEQMNERLVASQDIEAVETVTGATSSTKFFGVLAKAALENAKTGTADVAVLPMNGVYSAENPEFDERGWKARIEITFEDDKITSVAYSEFNAEGVQKFEDEAYNAKMLEASGTNPKTAYPILEASLVETQDVEKVDTVSGATHAADSFKALAKLVMEQRVPYAK